MAKQKKRGFLSWLGFGQPPAPSSDPAPEIADPEITDPTSNPESTQLPEPAPAQQPPLSPDHTEIADPAPRPESAQLSESTSHPAPTAVPLAAAPPANTTREDTPPLPDPAGSAPAYSPIPTTEIADPAPRPESTQLPEPDPAPQPDPLAPSPAEFIQSAGLPEAVEPAEHPESTELPDPAQSAKSAKSVDSVQPTNPAPPVQLTTPVALSEPVQLPPPVNQPAPIHEETPHLPPAPSAGSAPAYSPIPTTGIADHVPRPESTQLPEPTPRPAPAAAAPPANATREDTPPLPDPAGSAPAHSPIPATEIADPATDPKSTQLPESAPAPQPDPLAPSPAEFIQSAGLPETVEPAEHPESTELPDPAQSAKSVDPAELTDPAHPVQPPAPARPGFFTRLKQSLTKTRQNLGSGLLALFRGKKIDDNLFEQLEEQLLLADVGIETTRKIIDKLTNTATGQQLQDASALYSLLKQEMGDLLAAVNQPLTPATPSAGAPFILLMVGVNGVGKTTTIGKLARQFQQQGKTVMLAAGDTFRAAAVEQLQAWGERNQIPVIAQHTGADAASVIFDAIQAAKARKADILIADTAGRLQNKAHLMEELKKIVRVMKKLDPDAPHEIMLTLDASTGQNAISQTRLFHEAVGLSGITLTKLDGTAKGGVIFALADQFTIPLRYIGTGENLDDLRPFNAQEFIEALFAKEGPHDPL